ncbi:MAG: nucleoside hydrolase [Ignavibacteriales bacterium]|nr:nucleoside hydrolase [Ignavibacteriales bacterium]
MPIPVLIDTDTGVDDALALILALRSPELSVKAITTVAGNAGVQRCTRNVQKVLEVLHEHNTVPVVQGASKPLKRTLVTAPEVHGFEGLGNFIPVLLHYHTRVRANAVEVILGHCRKYPKRLNIIALGPLTNIAAAFKRGPSLMRNVRRIISMGGAFRVPGNTGPVAEFNYYVDPEAAEAVVRGRLPLTMVPLDLTEQIVLMRKDLEYRARRRPSALSRFILKFTRHYMRYHLKAEGFDGGFLHDPLAVAMAIDPRMFRSRPATVHVETRGRWTRGMSIADFRVRPSSRGSAVEVVFGVEKERFLRLFHERLWT